MSIFLYATASVLALGTAHPPIERVPGILTPGLRWPERIADHSRPSSAEVKNAWSYISNPQYVLMTWCLFKHRDSVTFYVL
jgi:hypothetical protein